MRILYINHDAEHRSGANKVLLDLLGCLKEDPSSVLMVVLPSYGPLVDELSVLEISAEVMPINYLWHPSSRKYYQEMRNLRTRLKNLILLVDKFKPDVIHCNTIYPVDGYLIGSMLGIPVVGHVHGALLPDDHPLLARLGLSSEWLGRFIGEACEQVVAVSDSVRTTLLPYVAPEKISVVANGLDLDDFDAKKSKVSNCGFDYPRGSNAKLTVLAIGRVCEEKGFDFLIDAARLVETVLPHSLQFLIVGPFEDLDLKNRLLAQVKNNGLEFVVIFLGPRDDVPYILTQVDIVLSSSRTEGLPFAVIEGMAACLPVVATRSGGPEQIIINGETGFLVDIDPSSISERLLDLARSPQLRHDLGRRARDYIEKNYTLRQFGSSWLDLYAGILSKKRPVAYRQHNQALDVAFNLLSEVGDLGVALTEQEKRIRDLEGVLVALKNNPIIKFARFIKNYF